MSEVTWWRRSLSEMVGTYFLVFVAAGLEVAAALAPGHIDRVAKAIAPALVIGAMIYALGSVSGAHFNPVVTMVFALRRALDPRIVPLYIAAQLVGAVAAASTLRWLWGTVRDVGANELAGVDALTGWGLETILTALLVLVVMNAAHEHSLIGPDAALPVGATIAAAGFVGGEFTGASLNPARSLGPAIVSGHWDDQWVYVAGPLVGGLVGLAAFTLLRPHRNDGECRAAQGEDVE